jgi:hypothetical protein
MIAAIPGNAWVYPEYQNIKVLAVQKLSTDGRASLDTIWAMARTGFKGRLSTTVVIVSLPEIPQNIDWGAWPAI